MNFTDSDSALTPEDIANVEAILSIELPPALRNLYLSFNGGVPNPYVFKNSMIDTTITEFLPLESAESDTSPKVYQRQVLDRGLVPKTFFPFAVEGGGDYFFVDTATSNGKVYFYRQDTADSNPLIDLNIGFEQFSAQLKSE